LAALTLWHLTGQMRRGDDAHRRVELAARPARVAE